MSKILIKNQPINVWEDWIENELTPPIQCGPQEAYVLEAFKEALTLFKRRL